MKVTAYILYDPTPTGLNRQKPDNYPSSYFYIGGGSSTPASIRGYDSEGRAEQMRDRYFPDAKILPVTIEVNND